MQQLRNGDKTYFRFSQHHVNYKVSVIYVLTYFLTVKPSKVVDIIGKFLTPFLIIALVVIIVKGIISPIEYLAKPMIDNVLSKGLIDGYQTMDCFVSLAVGSVLLLTLKTKVTANRNNK